MKIAIIGLGRVAMADALALARSHEVVMTGPLPERVEAINRGEYGLNDPGLERYLGAHSLNLRAVLDTAQALAQADMVFVSMPMSSDCASGEAKMVELDSRIEFAARHLPQTPIALRCFVPVGYCAAKRQELDAPNIVYAPEFGREGHMLSDVLHPEFLIVGDRHERGRHVLAVLESAALRQDMPCRQMGPTEAELTRHLSVLFRAMRVSCFNELDSYALHHRLDARQIIDGVCLDPRIGAHSNNPCLGYGCQTLPLSMRGLQPHLDPERTPIIAGIDKAHSARIDMLASQIAGRKPEAVSILLPRNAGRIPSAMARLKETLEAAGIRTQLHPADAASLGRLDTDCELIVAQRAAPELADIGARLFTRDHYA